MWGGANVPCRRWNLLSQDPALPFFIGLFSVFGKGAAVCLKPYPPEALGHDGRKGHPAAHPPPEQVIRDAPHIREALPGAGTNHTPASPSPDDGRTAGVFAGGGQKKPPQGERDRHSVTLI